MADDDPIPLAAPIDLDVIDAEAKRLAIQEVNGLDPAVQSSANYNLILDRYRQQLIDEAVRESVSM